MRLDRIRWKNNEYWDSAWIGPVYIIRAKSPLCHSDGVNYKAGQYYIESNKSRWHHLDPIAAQAILFHLFENNSEQETPEIPS